MEMEKENFLPEVFKRKRTETFSTKKNKKRQKRTVTILLSQSIFFLRRLFLFVSNVRIFLSIVRRPCCEYSSESMESLHCHWSSNHPVTTDEDTNLHLRLRRDCCSDRRLKRNSFRCDHFHFFRQQEKNEPFFFGGC